PTTAWIVTARPVKTNVRPRAAQNRGSSVKIRTKLSSPMKSGDALMLPNQLCSDRYNVYPIGKTIISTMNVIAGVTNTPLTCRSTNSLIRAPSDVGRGGGGKSPDGACGRSAV